MDDADNPATDTGGESNSTALATPDRTNTNITNREENDNAPQEENNNANDSNPNTPEDRLVNDFATDLIDHKKQEERALVAMVAFRAKGATAEMPTLKPGKWKCAGKPPNLISIKRARQPLEATCAKIPCRCNASGSAWTCMDC